MKDSNRNRKTSKQKKRTDRQTSKQNIQQTDYIIPVRLIVMISRATLTLCMYFQQIERTCNYRLIHNIQTIDNFRQSAYKFLYKFDCFLYE